MSHLLHVYGAWLVAALIALESAGLPLPGETSLITAGILAGTAQGPGIGAVIVAGVGGAVIGNLIGYGIGRALGYRLLARYGAYIGLTQARLKIGQYLFRRYGVVILVGARFLPVARSVAAVLAGANRMPPGRFVLGAIVGAALWAPAIATAGYLFGHEITQVSRAATIALAIAAAAILAAIAIVIARNEKALEAAADREL
jgi:membrane protein DedA with SNARE-associated domain